MGAAVFQDESVGESVRVVAVSGELDNLSAPELRRRVDRALHDGNAGLVVDLSGITHLDSSGLAALISAHQRLQDIGGRMAIVLSSRAVRRTFEIRGVDGLFNVAGSRDEAVGAVRD